jgi:hypothetical protein
VAGQFVDERNGVWKILRVSHVLMGHMLDNFAMGLGRGKDSAVVTGDLIHSPLRQRYADLHRAVPVAVLRACETVG